MLERVDAHAKRLDNMEHDAKKLKRAEWARQKVVAGDKDGRPRQKAYA
jgi:hypothetical protein